MKIAICGKMGSGKSYLANLITNKFNNIFIVKSFANKLKYIAADLFNMDIKNKDRKLLIDIGTKMREIDKNVWINALLKDIDENDYIVIDDLRLMNEYNILKSKNWFLIKININEEIRKNRIKNIYSKNFNSHFEHFNSITENDVVSLDDTKFDFIINSDSDYNKLLLLIEHKLKVKNKIINDIK